MVGNTESPRRLTTVEVWRRGVYTNAMRTWAKTYKHSITLTGIMFCFLAISIMDGQNHQLTQVLLSLTLCAIAGAFVAAWRFSHWSNLLKELNDGR